MVSYTVAAAAAGAVIYGGVQVHARRGRARAAGAGPAPGAAPRGAARRGAARRLRRPAVGHPPARTLCPCYPASTPPCLLALPLASSHTPRPPRPRQTQAKKVRDRAAVVDLFNALVAMDEPSSLTPDEVRAVGDRYGVNMQRDQLEGLQQILGQYVEATVPTGDQDLT